VADSTILKQIVLNIDFGYYYECIITFTWRLCHVNQMAWSAIPVLNGYRISVGQDN
jgi:hypothetical protein